MHDARPATPTKGQYTMRSSHISKVLKSCFAVTISLGIAGCGPEDTQAESKKESASAQAQQLVATIQRNGGILSVSQMLVEAEVGPLLSVGAVITNGPTQLSRSCATKVMGSCELTTCNSLVGQSDRGIDVGTLSVSSSAGTLSLLPEVNNSYGFVYNSFGPKTLWNAPGQMIKTSYGKGAGPRATVVQAAPAQNVIVTNTLPTEITKADDLALNFINANPKDGGQIYARLVAEDGVDTGNGILSRAMLSCAAQPNAGKVVLNKNVLSQLPAGPYLALVQAETRTVDANGVTHSLVAPVDFNIVEVTVK